MAHGACDGPSSDSSSSVGTFGRLRSSESGSKSESPVSMPEDAVEDVRSDSKIIK